MTSSSSLELSAAKRIVESVLRDRLGPAGFSKVAISEGRDPDGVPILKIRSIFKSGRTTLTGLDSIRAIHEVRRALLNAGDSRFPHVVHELPEDKAA